jgi:phosphoribosylformylglycinamidine synthase
MKKPRVGVIRTDGVNCEEETLYAFTKAGAEGRIVHINQLRSKEENLADYQILALPGGFSHSDDVHSGKILAAELTSFFQEELRAFAEAGKLILGLGSGFQTLLRIGLLPEPGQGQPEATLMTNQKGQFQCRWVQLRVEPVDCVFTKGLAGSMMDLQVANGEGRFYSEQAVADQLGQNKQVVFRYADPANPSGSSNAIAGICDPTGRIMGMTPHPERYVEKTQHHNWRRMDKDVTPHGLAIFQNAVEYARQA